MGFCFRLSADGSACNKRNAKEFWCQSVKGECNVMAFGEEEEEAEAEAEAEAEEEEEVVVVEEEVEVVVVDLQRA